MVKRFVTCDIIYNQQHGTISFYLCGVRGEGGEVFPISVFVRLGGLHCIVFIGLNLTKVPVNIYLL